MTIAQMATVAEIITSAASGGMILVGGVKAVLSLLGLKDEPSPEELAAITALTVADATRRGNERRLMAGL